MGETRSLNILWLKTGPLHPLDTGGKIRTYNMLRELKKRHRLTYLALYPEHLDASAKAAASEYSTDQVWIPWRETPKGTLPFYLELLQNFVASRQAYIMTKYASVAMSAKIAELDRSGKYDLIICDFLTPAVNLFAGNAQPQTPTLIFQHNVESMIWKRMFTTAKNPLKKFYLKGQWQRMHRFEAEACARFGGVVAVSEEDATVFREEFGLKNVLGAVPTGVDVDFFSPEKNTPKPQSLGFLGSMDWLPNIDAIDFFVAEMWSDLKQEFPDLNFTIIGRNPPARIKELEKTHPGIHVTGTVKDVRPHLQGVEALIVPLRIGGGTRIKIFEAMAAGLPVISTRIGAEGLPVTHDEHISLADAPADFVREISRLFREPATRQRIGQNGLKLVRDQFGWSRVNDIFSGYCQRVCSQPKKTP